MPLLTRRRLLSVEHETTPGTAETPADADGVLLVTNLAVPPQIPFGEREGVGPALSHFAGQPGARMGQITFTVEVTGGSGAFWAARLLPACGIGGTTTSFTLDSRHPEVAGSAQETVTLGFFQDGLLYRLTGAMGNVVFRFVTGDRIFADFTMTGKWVQPVNNALLDPTFDTSAPIRFASSTVSVGSFVPKVSTITIDLGNEVIMREDPSSVQGYHTAAIVARRPNGSMDPEATLIGTHGSAVYDPNTDWLDRVTRALDIQPSGFRLQAPALQVTNCTLADRNGLAVHNVEFQLVRSVSAGDDELAITLS